MCTNCCHMQIISNDDVLVKYNNKQIIQLDSVLHNLHTIYLLYQCLYRIKQDKTSHVQ